MKKRVFSLLLVLAMVFSILPMNILAVDRDEAKDQVRVIVENTTFLEPVDDVEPDWTGTLVDTWVDLTPASTMMSCVVAALDEVGATQTGAESNYISSINGLEEFEGGSMSGWMGTLNDWFTNEGFGAFTVASGKLSAGDEIRIMYTCSYGEDLGGSWGNNDTSLKALAFSDGTLEPAFDGAVQEYTLTIPKSVSQIQITPTAANKNFQVHTKIGETEYKRTAFVPVADGTVLTIECGTGLSMNSGAVPTVYTVSVVSLDSEAVAAVISLIDAIGEPRDSAAAITKARKAYDALSENEKALVTNYEKLTAAEKALSELPHADFDKMYEQTGALLEQMFRETPPQVGSIGGEWVIIGLARSGRELPDGYYESAAAYIDQTIKDPNKEQLHRAKSTENSRVILALTAMGMDVTDVAGHNLLKGLSDMKYLKKQGNNGPIWALIAFDSHDYEIPTVYEGGEQVTREMLIDYILDVQLADGGWTLSNNPDSVADADMTGMALQALAPYYGKIEKVTEAVDKALAVMSDIQLANGGFDSWGTVNVESCVQILVALNSLGIDARTDSRFIKNGRTILDALSDFYVEGGGFRHITSQEEMDGMATEQSYYGMTSMYRLAHEQTSLYDMSEMIILPFPDIDYDVWYREDVKFMVDKGLMNGLPDGEFKPYESLTRGQMVTILYRMAGSVPVEGKAPYTDVGAGAYCHDAVLWAHQNNITTGYPDGTFAPMQRVTREEFATFLMRYAAFTGEDTSARADLGAYRDLDNVHPYAMEAMQWAVAEGLINGTSTVSLSPRAGASRLQVAVIIHRYYQAFEMA